MNTLNSTILLIENDAAIQENITTILNQSGCEVYTAKFLNNALNYYKAHHRKIVLVIMERELHGISTYFMLNFMASYSNYLQALILSSSHEQAKLFSYHPSFCGLLLKPFSTHDLNKIVARQNHSIHSHYMPPDPAGKISQDQQHYYAGEQTN